MLRDICEEVGIEPQRTVMIGDTTHDLRMAHSAGAFCGRGDLRRPPDRGTRRARAGRLRRERRAAARLAAGQGRARRSGSRRVGRLRWTGQTRRAGSVGGTRPLRRPRSPHGWSWRQVCGSEALRDGDDGVRFDAPAQGRAPCRVRRALRGRRSRLSQSVPARAGRARLAARPILRRHRPILGLFHARGDVPRIRWRLRGRAVSRAGPGRAAGRGNGWRGLGRSAAWECMMDERGRLRGREDRSSMRAGASGGRRGPLGARGDREAGARHGDREASGAPLGHFLQARHGRLRRSAGGRLAGPVDACRAQGRRDAPHRGDRTQGCARGRRRGVGRRRDRLRSERPSRTRRRPESSFASTVRAAARCRPA